MTDFNKKVKVPDWPPPLGIKNVKVFGISPLSAAILRTFSNWGGPVRAFFGGASLETFSGEAQLKKSPCILLAQAVCCPVAVLSNVWLLVIGYDEQPGARNIPCASLILARHIVAHFFLISTIFIFIFRSLIILYADTGLER